MPGYTPPVTPNYVNPPTRGHEATDAALVSLIFATIAVVLRLFTKFYMTHSQGWDDVCSVLALGFGIIRLGLAFHLVDVGYGRHLWDVLPSNYNTLQTSLGSDVIVYIVGIAFAKLAVLILLHRIFGIDKRFRWACYLLGPIIFLWSFITAMTQIFRCRPVKAAWNAEYTLEHPDGYKCLDRILISVTYGWFNIFSDFILLLLPLPMLWKLHLPWQKKLGLLGVFITGGFVCAVSIIRQAVLYHNNASGSGQTDGTWTEITNYVWFRRSSRIEYRHSCWLLGDFPLVQFKPFTKVDLLQPTIHPILRHFTLLKDHLPPSFRSLFSSSAGTTKINRSKKSTQGDKSIELAEEGRASKKKQSEDSGGDTLLDPAENDFRWTTGILRTDQYAVSTEDLQAKEKRARGPRNDPLVYQGKAL
ncbi:hypothetical protein G7Y79_00034g069080 [Physcia stellaris]|nr:hypothetical protein G7Y79_00034g069080 [Physcia stellaris]